MSLISQAVRNLHNLAYLIETPSLFKLYQRGGLPKSFIALNQPWLHALNITTVLDIGANIGRFATTINAVLPKAKIYSFEPLPDCFEQLQLRMANVKNFTGFNIALGEESGDLPFERNAFSPSSSFLKMNDLHKSAFPRTCHEKTVNIKVERLDSFAERIVIAEPLLVKIDVQGYEDRVLRGGEQTIRRAKLIVTETSFERLYTEQPLFDEIYHILSEWGFVYAGALGQLQHPQSGKVIQQDSIFAKPP